MSIRFRVEPSSPVPIYVQLVDQVKRAVAGGMLLAGDQLPSVRELAMRLRINPNTVVRAYMELERDGITVTRKGRGTFVAEGVRSMSSTERMRDIEGAIEQMLQKAYDYKIEPESVRRILEDKMTQVFNRDRCGNSPKPAEPLESVAPAEPTEPGRPPKPTKPR